MANLQGIIHALRKKVTKLDQVIEELGSDFGNMTDRMTNTENILRAVISGELELARVQSAEAGGFNILPPPPTLPTPEPATNGAKEPEKGKVEKALVEVK